MLLHDPCFLTVIEESLINLSTGWVQYSPKAKASLLLGSSHTFCFGGLPGLPENQATNGVVLEVFFDLKV